MLKYLTYFIKVFVIAVTMQICTLLSIEGSNRVINFDDSTNPTESILDTARSTIVIYIIFLFVLQPLTILFSITIILDSIFERLATRPIKVLNIDSALNIVILVGNSLIYSVYPFEVVTHYNSTRL